MSPQTAAAPAAGDQRLAVHRCPRSRRPVHLRVGSEDPASARLRADSRRRGLALFAVSGAQKALDFHLGPLTAMVLGMLTGIGGGMMRDILAAEGPAVLRGDIYAVAAMAGAAVVVVGRMLNLPATTDAIAGAALCFAIRFAAINQGAGATGRKRHFSLTTVYQRPE